MLSRLLTLIREEPELSHADLCQRLEISPQILQSMLDILIRKGKLAQDETPGCGGNSTCTQKSCPGPDECELVLIKPINQVRITTE